MSGKHVYWVQLQYGYGDRARLFSVVAETDAPSLEDLTERLVRDGAVLVNKLYVVSDGRGGSLIQRREPFTIGTAGLVSMQNYSRPVWEPED